MALRSLLSRYRSISRPSLSSGGSSTYSSVAKKQQSAEDAIIDDQYEQGNLSAESYLLKLRERLGRTGATPLQVQNLTEKMRNVQVDVVDASYSNAYQAGQITSRDMYDYERAKLEKMTEPGSEAYIKQQQKVQGLLDKSEREDRSDARRQTMLEISQMPEDSSERTWSKYSLYDQLEQQARLDGDNEQADNLAIQKNNYQSAAKRADINDLITGTKLQVSETFGAGAGVPNAEGGASLYSELTGGGSPGISSPAVKNALESLDRQKKSLDRLYQSKSDKEQMISTYEQAVNAATGDQKTQLTIALNNLTSDIAGIDNQIANTTQNITDTVYKVQEINQKAAASSFNQEVRKNNSMFDKAETDLETEFKKGRINKEEYIAKGIELAQTKAMFFEQASNGFSQFGNEASADSYMEKTNQAIDIHESLVNVAQNLDDYEPIFTDKDSNLTNLFGEKIRKGDVVLQDVRQLKDSGRWKENYANVDGTFHRIQYEGLGAEYLDDDGFLISGLSADKNFSKLVGNAYVYTVKDGKVGQERITFLEGKDGIEAVTETKANKLVEDGAVIKNQQGGLIWKPEIKENLLMKAAAKTQQVLEDTVPGFKAYEQNFRDLYSKNTLNKIGDTTGNIVSKVTNYYKNFYSPIVEKGIEGAKNIFQKGKDFASTAIGGAKDYFNKMNPFNPPEVGGSDLVPEGVSGSVGDIIDKVAEQMKPGDLEFKKVLHAIALAESGGDPNAVGDNGQSIGLFQNRMKFGRGGNYSKEQLLDPQFNTELAAKELVRYYDQAVSKGLSGSKAVAYVSKYGQRPAPGNENQAASKYGQFVSKAIGSVKSIFEGEKNVPVKDYTTESLPDPNRIRNIELALGLQSGQYRKGLKQDQGAIDKGFRGDTSMQELLREEGFTPSWESNQSTQAPISSPTPRPSTVNGQPIQQQSSWNPPKIDIPKITQNIGQTAQKATTAVKNYFTPEYNSGKNFWSTPVAQGLGNIQTSIQKVTQPVVSKVQQAVNTTKSWFSNLFKR